ncbi:MAG: RloB domain-containing protein, partial [Muribaculaceae bacterium]|nr:RloB domain-containing protein [Muribaculaceae bacterium]
IKFKQKYNHKKVGKTDCEVVIYESFPSIELFFFYYFENSTAEKTNSGLKKWLNHKCGYEPTTKFLISHSLHELLTCKGGNLGNAIKNSKLSLSSRIDGNLNCSYSEIGYLIESLGLKKINP